MDPAVNSVLKKARVVAYDERSGLVYFETADGGVLSVSGLDRAEWPTGAIALVEPDFDHIERAPDEVWPSPKLAGVVRLRLDDITLIDFGGQLRRVPTSRADYRVGNTVEFTENHGVLRVLSPDPVRFLDLPGIDDSTVDSFRVEAEVSRGLSFDAFAGSPQLVRRAKELIELPIVARERLKAIGARPVKGVLFTGPPGTGKTLLARIIASQADAVFYEIRGPEVFSKWYGESEELLRRIFDAAAAKERAIIFFDEIDSIAGSRDEGHEASRRVVAQLLTLMDGFDEETNVVVVATTNRPDDLDVALRRPGRFDWELQFPLPSLDDRLAILQMSAAELACAEDLPHAAAAERSEGWSAAELAAVFREAALLAAEDDRSRISAEDYLGGFQRVSERVDRRLLQAGS